MVRSWRQVAILAESLKLDPVLDRGDDVTEAQNLAGKLETAQLGIVYLKTTIDRTPPTWANPGSQSVANHTKRGCSSRTITNRAEFLQNVEIFAYLRYVTARYEFGLPHDKGIYVKPRVASAGQSDPDVDFDVQDFNANRDPRWLILSDSGTGRTTLPDSLAYSLTRRVPQPAMPAMFCRGQA